MATNPTRRTLTALAITATILTGTAGCVLMPPPIDSLPTATPAPTSTPQGKPTPGNKPAPTQNTPAGSIEEACLELFNNWYRFTPDITELQYDTSTPIADATQGTDPTCTITITNVPEIVAGQTNSNAGIETLTLTLLDNPPTTIDTQIADWAEAENLTPIPGLEGQTVGGGVTAVSLWQGLIPETEATTEAPTTGTWAYGRSLLTAAPSPDQQAQALAQFEQATGLTVDDTDRLLVHGQGWFPAAQ